MLFIFKSTHEVIKAEKCCNKQGISCKIVPIPRSLSTECGMGIEVNEDQSDRLVSLLKKSKINHKTHNQNKA